MVTNQRREGSLLGPYRVLDLSDEKGVLCGKVLADLGADVIKVEPPSGDPMRHIGPFYHDIPDPEKSLYWFTFNTSKRSVTLDITKARGQEIFKEMARTADFVIECFPPGYLAEYGLGYPVLSKLNPRLIMTSITPFGQSGPYRDFKAYDIVGLAMGGLMYLNGEREYRPVRVRAQQAYAQASVQAAAGTMVAHYHRQTTGEGQHVDVSMQEAVSNTLDTAQQAWNLQEMERNPSCTSQGRNFANSAALRPDAQARSISIRSRSLVPLWVRLPLILSCSLAIVVGSWYGDRVLGIFIFIFSACPSQVIKVLIVEYALASVVGLLSP